MDQWLRQCIGCLLIIGKDGHGITVGIENAKKLLEDIPNKVRDILGIMVEVNLFELGCSTPLLP